MQTSGNQTSRVHDLRSQFNAVRSYTSQICEPLEIEDYIPQPIADVSPPKWNIAHTTWFFEEMILKKFVPGYKVFDEQFGFLFNSYYISIGDRTRRDQRGDLSRPTVKRVLEYRKHVDAQMDDFLAGGLADDARELLILGLNHEQQHQELFLTDLKYIFSVNPLFPVYREGYFPEESVDDDPGNFIKFKGGTYQIGHSGDGFCFDNELTRHQVFLDDFEISSTLVTNAEFLDFIDDGGYSNTDLWHSEGWDWVKNNAIASPLYWHNIDGKWHHFTLGGLRELPSSAPVCHVSYYEAAAFAEWKGSRLPTEFEWETASDLIDWGKRWEWTGSSYLAYPGFKKPHGAVGEYNGKFMINQMVLRGSSAVTPVGHSRSTYRNFFHPHLRWQFTGIRLAK